MRFDAVPEALRALLCDAMTSGGLLVAVAASAAPRDGARRSGGRTATRARIGVLEAGRAGPIEVVSGVALELARSGSSQPDDRPDRRAAEAGPRVGGRLEQRHGASTAAIAATPSRSLSVS